MTEISTFNGCPVVRKIKVDIGQVEKLECANIDTTTLKIDTKNTTDELITSKLKLNSKELINVETGENQNDSKIIASKAYIDDNIPDLSNYYTKEELINDNDDGIIDIITNEIDVIDNDLNNNSTGIKKQITTINNSISTINNDINNTSTGIKKQITDINDEIDDIEDDINNTSTGIKKQITDLTNNKQDNLTFSSPLSKNQNQVSINYNSNDFELSSNSLKLKNKKTFSSNDFTDTNNNISINSSTYYKKTDLINSNQTGIIDNINSSISSINSTLSNKQNLLTTTNSSISINSNNIDVKYDNSTIKKNSNNELYANITIPTITSTSPINFNNNNISLNYDTNDLITDTNNKLKINNSNYYNKTETNTLLNNKQDNLTFNSPLTKSNNTVSIDLSNKQDKLTTTNSSISINNSNNIDVKYDNSTIKKNLNNELYCDVQTPDLTNYARIDTGHNNIFNNTNLFNNNVAVNYGNTTIFNVYENTLFLNGVEEISGTIHISIGNISEYTCGDTYFRGIKFIDNNFDSVLITTAMCRMGYKSGTIDTLYLLTYKWGNYSYITINGVRWYLYELSVGENGMWRLGDALVTQSYQDQGQRCYLKGINSLTQIQFCNFSTITEGAFFTVQLKDCQFRVSKTQLS